MALTVFLLRKSSLQPKDGCLPPGIASLKGIEVFTSLEQLICGYNQLTQLDVRKNRSLTYLYCAFNRIEQLDLSGLHKLTALNCAGNTLTSLNLAGCTALEVVYCRNNRLTAVNFSDNTRLQLMDVFDNQLTRVDLSRLKDLEFRLPRSQFSDRTGFKPKRQPRPCSRRLYRPE